MRERGWRMMAAAALTAALLAGARGVGAQEASRAKSAAPAAKVGDEVVTLDELEQGLAAQLAQLERQRHTLLTQKLDQLIGERLLAQEAKRRGLTTEQLLKAEVYAKAPEVSDAEVTSFLAQNRARLPRAEEGELRLKAWDYLRSQRLNQQREAYVRILRAQTQVTVYLAEPAPIRVQVTPDKGFARGPKEAPVVIVEFSDFQCPFCKNVVPTITQILGQYPGKVRWIFRDFPIPSLHPAAPKAHEAARCAAAQGKFWEYHDLLFERSPRHSPPELKQYAQELNLDGAAFAQCLDGGTQQAEVASDVEEGTRLGVSGTPTFYINGRPLVGAQPLTAFQRLIESELVDRGAK